MHVCSESGHSFQIQWQSTLTQCIWNSWTLQCCTNTQQTQLYKVVCQVPIFPSRWDQWQNWNQVFDCSVDSWMSRESSFYSLQLLYRVIQTCWIQQTSLYWNQAIFGCPSGFYFWCEIYQFMGWFGIIWCEFLHALGVLLAFHVIWGDCSCSKKHGYKQIPADMPINRYPQTYAQQLIPINIHR
jgi:hypothetical protein